MIEQQIAQPQRQVLFLELDSRITRRRHDAAPVGVGAENGRLDQGAFRDRLGHAVRLASSRNPSTSMVTRCVAPSASAAMARASSPHTSAIAAPNRAQRLALQSEGPTRLVAPLASSSSVSLVLVWPSTLMQLKVWSAALRASAARSSGRHGGVGEDEGQHGGHVRPDHGRPLGHARQADVDAVQIDRRASPP